MYDLQSSNFATSPDAEEVRVENWRGCPKCNRDFRITRRFVPLISDDIHDDITPIESSGYMGW